MEKYIIYTMGIDIIHNKEHGWNVSCRYKYHNLTVIENSLDGELANTYFNESLSVCIDRLLIGMKAMGIRTPEEVDDLNSKGLKLALYFNNVRDDKEQTLTNEVIAEACRRNWDYYVDDDL